MKKRGSTSEFELPVADKVILETSMVRPRSGPTLKKFMILTAVLVATVLLYRMISSPSLHIISKQSSNRAFYEQMYSEVSDEVADWRQRYDREFSRAEENRKALEEVLNQAKELQEENKTLKGEVARLKQLINGTQEATKGLEV